VKDLIVGHSQRIVLSSRVWCVILNWNGAVNSIECLTALKCCTYPNLTVLLVDNGSTDDSVERIQVAHPDILLLESATNLGFAGGNNIGIRYALARKADYIWLLNNDTKPAPDALLALVSKAESDRRIGAVGSVCYYAQDPSKVQAWAGARINLWLGYGRLSTVPRRDDWFHSLNAASMLISRAALEDVGLLDQAFFMYWEDTEFCLRLRKKRWQIAAAPDSHVLHKVNASARGNKSLLDRLETASVLRILKLHSPAPALAAFFFLCIRFTRRVLRLEFARCRSVFQGILEYQQKRAGAQQIR
jgi:GT2 family glycosyltransferase